MLREGVNEILFPYQREGIDWLSRRGSYLLADQRGLGKSLQVLGDINTLRRFRPQARTLLVAPNRAIYKWAEAEIPKWTTFSAEVASGTAVQRKHAINAAADITIIAYDNLERNLTDLNEQGFYYLVFDEAHNIKGRPYNPRSTSKNKGVKRTLAAFNLRGARRGMVTGSPFLNRVDEMWSLLFMVAPLEFGDYWRYLNRYAVYGGYENRQVVGIQNEPELRAKIAPYTLRRTLAEVGQHIPPLTKIKVPIDLSPAQRGAYNMARNELKVEFDGRTVLEFENPMVRMIRLRQIIRTLASVGGPDDSALLDAAVDKIQEIDSNEKIVVFSGDLIALSCMRKRLAALGIDAPIIAGKDETGKVTNARAREPIVQAFQTRREPRVLLASHGVAREAIDLYAARYGIKLDKMWVPELDDQEDGRLHRTGQTDPVIIYEMFARNTIDSRVDKILAEKSAVFNSLFGVGQETFIHNLLNERMAELLDA